MNKKGFIVVGGIGAIMFYTMTGIFTSMAIASYVLKDSHRERKYVEKCSAGYHTEDYCKDKVAKMDKKEILAYIKDDDMTQGNKGFVN